MKSCPCGSQLTYEECCRPLIKGRRKAATAEQLMRSRYSAYVEKEIPYLRTSLHPDHRNDYDEKASRDWAESAEWHSLQILNTVGGGPEDERGPGRVRRHVHAEERPAGAPRAVHVRPRGREVVLRQRQGSEAQAGRARGAQGRAQRPLPLRQREEAQEVLRGPDAVELIEAIRGRRSCRRFTAEAVPREALERIVEAATWAPSGKNRQNWRIFVSRGETRDRLAEIAGRSFAFHERCCASTTRRRSSSSRAGSSATSAAPRWCSSSTPRRRRTARSSTCSPAPRRWRTRCWPAWPRGCRAAG